MKVRLLVGLRVIALAASLAIVRPAGAQPATQTSVGLAASGSPVALTGPWRFSLGDDSRWSRPGFDDRGWETVDLSPKRGAHDDDVGIAGYVPGWSARGHAGYGGFGWYRLRIDLRAPPMSLALAGPTLIDSAYEIYWDGRRVGSLGDFTRAPPVAYGIRPMRFALGRVVAGVHTVAIRTWMDPAEAGAPQAGGIHVAPILGPDEAIAGVHRRQAWVTFEGYVVDALEPAAFLALAAWALFAGRRRRTMKTSAWLALALTLTALVRLNQPLFFWTSWESLHAYDALRSVIETPGALAAWVVAFTAWLRPSGSRFAGPVALLLGLGLAVAQLVSRPWIDIAGAPHWRPLAHGVAADLRLGFVALFAWLIGWGMAARRKGTGYAAVVASAVLLAIGLFADELSKLGVKGIWFLFGIGVSRTQFAYAAAVLTLSIMLASTRSQEDRDAR